MLKLYFYWLINTHDIIIKYINEDVFKVLKICHDRDMYCQEIESIHNEVR